MLITKPQCLNAFQGNWLCYEELLAAERSGLSNFQWPEFDEGTACGMCYTSGTTGRPKVRQAGMNVDL